MAVYAVKYNPHYSNVFLSASADWTVKLWEQDSQKPIMTFDLASPVGDIAWAPYSSTIFAAVTAEGKVSIAMRYLTSAFILIFNLGLRF